MNSYEKKAFLSITKQRNYGFRMSYYRIIQLWIALLQVFTSLCIFRRFVYNHNVIRSQCVVDYDGITNDVDIKKEWFE